MIKNAVASHPKPFIKWFVPRLVVVVIGIVLVVVVVVVVAIGVALFLQGLELSIFPLGKSLSNQFARRGSLVILLAFGFAMGFSAVIAEPALIAVAEQAQTISGGRIDSLTLRVLVALSVGFVVYEAPCIWLVMVYNSLTLL